LSGAKVRAEHIWRVLALGSKLLAIFAALRFVAKVRKDLASTTRELVHG